MMIKFNGAVIWRLSQNVNIRKYSTIVGVSVMKRVKGDDKNVTATSLTKDSGLVAAAFASLNTTDETPEQSKPSRKSPKMSRDQLIEYQISKATDVDSLLKVSENAIVSRMHALKIVSVLSEWSNSKKVNLSDFEKDPRFLKLCRILARTNTTLAINSLAITDVLNMISSITGDDEAARMVPNLELPQLVKVLKVLKEKGRRSTPLLRALAHTITNSPVTIDLKQSSDILYTIAALNFPDPVLLDRLCSDIISELPQNENKIAVVNSITGSLGYLKYRHEMCLDSIIAWFNKHPDITRSTDVANIFITLATVDYLPKDCEKLIETALSIKEDDLTKPIAWLDLVFSLLVLNKATEKHLSSTLTPEFIDKLLTAGEIPIPTRRKLMSIDGYISLAFPNYNGPRLHNDMKIGVPIIYTKEKNLYVQSVMDTFKNLVSSDNFMKKQCNSHMGFLYECEFALDNKCHPVLLEKAAMSDSVHRIAVLSLDYHDLCRKSQVPLGIYQLYTRILQLQGYKVLQIPYTEFTPKDKLITRVQYIEQRLKELVSSDH